MSWLSLHCIERSHITNIYPLLVSIKLSLTQPDSEVIRNSSKFLANFRFSFGLIERLTISLHFTGGHQQLGPSTELCCHSGVRGLMLVSLFLGGDWGWSVETEFGLVVRMWDVLQETGTRYVAARPATLSQASTPGQAMINNNEHRPSTSHSQAFSC